MKKSLMACLALAAIAVAGLTFAAGPPAASTAAQERALVRADTHVKQAPALAVRADVSPVSLAFAAAGSVGRPVALLCSWESGLVDTSPSYTFIRWSGAPPRPYPRT